MARKYLVSLDLSKNELQNAVVQVLASAPSSPVEGQIYYNSVDHKAYIYNATTWQALDQATVISYGATATTQAIGDSQTPGAASSVSRSDHKHGLPAFGSVTSQTSFGASSTSGVATTIAKSDHTHGTPTHDGTAHNGVPLSSLAAPVASVSFNSQKITNLATPTADTDAATKGYVDSTAAGLDVKGSVRVATTGPITLSGPGTSIDGVTLTANDRVLVKNQAAGADNGIYVFNGSAAAMTRALDADTSAEVTAGMFVFVEEGTQAETGWVLATNAPITLGTTSLSFTQFNATVSYTAGNGIDITGGAISTKLLASGGLAFSGSSLAVDTAIVARKYSTLVGNGAATSFSVAHGLGTADVTVQVYDAATGVQVEADVTHALTSPYAVTVAFTAAPASNAYKVVVIG